MIRSCFTSGVGSEGGVSGTRALRVVIAARSSPLVARRTSYDTKRPAWEARRCVVEWGDGVLHPGRLHRVGAISVYVNAIDDDGYLVEQYADRLGKARVGKAAINFKTVADINLDVLLQLVAEAEAQVPSV